MFAALAVTGDAASATPQIESTRLDGAVAGKPVELRVRATDPQAPVTGMVAGFGRGESGFGLSSCLPPDSAGVPFGPAAAPGGRTTLTAPHTYDTPGTRDVGARIMSAGCTGGQPSTLIRLRVPVVPAGQRPQPVQPQSTREVPLGVPFPALPGLGQIPAGRVDLPVGLPVAGVTAACPGSYRRFRRTRRGERAARSALLCLLNAERAKRGLPRVRGNGRLVRAANGHSRAMVTRRFFAHVGPGSIGLVDRLRRAGYIPARGGTWLVGENIGFGRGRYTRPATMHRAWMNSTPHRAAMLERRFREVGFGIVSGRPYGGGGATFTADFGRRR
ncbi:MAG TPA: CAP domain-containing protein [Thermoleophilaceae bacterium]|nr:CAP domain-containing protein [Thermoleophilaceae bacterium]